MTLEEAKKTARELIGYDMAFSHRNVWVFYAPVGTGVSDVVITKDGASVKRTGVFTGDPDTGELTDHATGETVSVSDVFGAAFYEEDPSLLIDHTAFGDMELKAGAAALHGAVTRKLMEAGVSFTIMAMLDDLVEEYDAAAYKRLVVLYNYLEKNNWAIDVKEFSFMHHELCRLR